MALGSFTLEGFGGLDLSRDPTEVGASGAVDLLNVDFDRRGRVRQRDGVSTFSTQAPTTVWGAVGAHVGSTQVIGWDIATVSAGTLHAFNSSGTSLANTAFAWSSPQRPTFTTIGTTSATYTYAIGPAATKRWDGSSWAGAVGVAQGTDATVQPWDNRLALAGQPNPYAVSFSDPGTPETFGVNNYVSLVPGDGEVVSNIVTWGNRVFAFKRTKFFVFYGTSTDSAGNPIFNYSPEYGTGVEASIYGYGAVAAPDGVYFIGRDGIFRTKGGPAERVSRAIDPYLRSESMPFFSPSAPTNWQSTALLSTYGEHVVLAVTSPAGLFRYTPSTDTWTYFDLTPVNGIGYANTTYNHEDYIFPGVIGGSSRLYRLSPTYTDDNGTAITSRYRSGLYDMGASEEKEIRDTDVHGTGTVGFSVARGYGSFPTARTLTLGTAPTPAEAHDSSAQYGEFLSYKLSSVSGAPWQVNRITHHLRPNRLPDMRAAA